MRDYTILVNSTDSFQDTWAPFFHLFEKYWPHDNERPVLLNTETKAYGHSRVDVRPTRVGLMSDDADLPWGECTLRALELVDTPLVLYMQDDYFLEDEVGVDLVGRWAKLMLEHGYDNIRLLECGNAGPWSETQHPLLWKVDPKAEYRISLQAGLWHVETLKEHIRRHETPWEFEVYGSMRARRADDRILCVNRDKFHPGGEQVIPYTPTGIVKGKWKLEVVKDLFRKHGIEVDYSKRGIYTESDQPKERGLAKKLTDPTTFRKVFRRIRSLY